MILTLFGALSLHQTSAQVFNPWGPPPNDKEIDANFLRKVANYFSVEVAVGYGNTRYRQNLDNFSILSENGQLLLLARDSATNQSVGIGNWLNVPFPTDTFSISNAIPYDQNMNEQDPDRAYLIEGNQQRLNGWGDVIPIHAKIHFNYDRYRLGAGATFELNTKAKMSLKGFPDFIGTYESDFSTFFTRKYYITAGVRYFDFWDFSYFADLEYGNFKLSQSAFPEALVANSNYWNLSLPIEKNLSEYFRLVMRPSMDFKSINTLQPTGETIKTNMWNVQFQVGIRMSFPLYGKCPISNCKAQKEHKHIDKKFRGQPLHKWQNPKVGQLHPYLVTQKRGVFDFLKRK